MNNERRQILKGAGAAAVVAVAAGAGLLKPGNVFAADWNKAAFEAKDVATAMAGIGATGAAESDQIVVDAPNIAENGSRVPVKVTSKIANTEHIIILAEKNTNPLIADFALSNGADGFISTAIKLGATGNVRAVVKAGGKVYTAAKEVKVTIGGCGG
ncbi:MAG TPA: thiosulfate oxidation carrier protein SoxY [Parasulfuritortus sp.]